MLVQSSYPNCRVLVNELNAKPQIEKQFAVKGDSSLATIPSRATSTERIFIYAAVNHAQTYWSILERRKGSELRLTRMDQEIYDHLMEVFPDFDSAAPLDEDKMKSEVGKEKWRLFMKKYEQKVRYHHLVEMQVVELVG